MIIIVNKCHVFGIMKKKITSTQTKPPKPYFNNEVISPSRYEERIKYLGRYFNFSINNQKHKEELLETTTTSLNNIDKLPLHPNNKLSLCSKYFLSKL